MTDNVKGGKRPQAELGVILFGVSLSYLLAVLRIENTHFIRNVSHKCAHPLTFNREFSTTDGLNLTEWLALLGEKDLECGSKYIRS